MFTFYNRPISRATQPPMLTRCVCQRLPECETLQNAKGGGWPLAMSTASFIIESLFAQALGGTSFAICSLHEAAVWQCALKGMPQEPGTYLLHQQSLAPLPAASQHTPALNDTTQACTLRHLLVLLVLTTMHHSNSCSLHVVQAWSPMNWLSRWHV